MSFASEKLYKDYLRLKMPTIVTTVKVRQIVPHLPCLTDYDRETIEAKRETCGNYNGMMLLLDCLKRRQNWPEQFIEALEACDHPTIAAGIRREYDALRGINSKTADSNPSSSPTTVIRAHVHPEPSASHVSTPENVAVTPAAESAPLEPAEASAGESAPPEPAEASAPPEPAEASAGGSHPPEPAGASAGVSAPPEPAEPSPGGSHPPEPAEPSPGGSHPSEPAGASAGVSSAPPEPAAQASTPPEAPVQPQAPQDSAAQVSGALSSPEPATEPPQPTPIEVAPAPLTPATTPPSLRETRPHQEPEENSESDIQDICGDNGGMANEVGAAIVEAEQSEPESSPSPDLLRPTTTTTTEVKSPQSPSPAQLTSDQTDDSSFPVMTPEKPPIQDTTPPVDINPAAVQQPAETAEPATTQVVESKPQTQTADPAFLVPDTARMIASLLDGDTACLSKPGQLISIQSQNHGSPTLPAPSSPVEPYSGNSERLEISNSTATSIRVPTCSSASTSIGNTVSALPCQENGVAINHIEPEENQYGSPCQSMETQDVRVNVVQISEEPSILNLGGRSSTPQAQNVNGEAAKEADSAPPLPTNAADAVSSENTAFSVNYNANEPPADASSPELRTLQDSEEASPHFLPVNAKYFLTAAGVGACALLMAWKFKN